MPDTHTDHGHSDDVALVAGIVAGELIGSAVARDRAAEPKAAEPWVEPDYPAIWARRWRWIKPLLVVAGAGLVVLAWWALTR